MTLVLGIFVGGAARRMGGAPKGLLEAPDGTGSLVGRLVRLAGALGFEPVLVGKSAAYGAAFPSLPVLDDAPAGVGPVGGLHALCRYAQPDAHVLAVACDMPRVSAAFLSLLAAHPSAAPVLAPRGAAGYWEPLCARYAVRALLPHLEAALACSEYSLQRLLARAGVDELPLSDEARGELIDWDAPEDVTR